MAYNYIHSNYYRVCVMLISWNSQINLTMSVEQPNEVFLKYFAHNYFCLLLFNNQLTRSNSDASMVITHIRYIIFDVIQLVFREVSCGSERRKCKCYFGCCFFCFYSFTNIIVFEIRVLEVQFRLFLYSSRKDG